MTLRDHRNKAKQWSYGRAQLAPGSAKAHYGKRRTRLTKQRVEAAAKEQQEQREQLQADEQKSDTGTEGSEP